MNAAGRLPASALCPARDALRDDLPAWHRGYDSWVCNSGADV